MPEGPAVPCGTDTVPAAAAWRYRDDVLAELEKHGVRPLVSTPPSLVAAYLNDLYRYELRRLRDGAVRRHFPQAELSARVVELRNRYPLVSLPVRFWAEIDNRDGAVERVADDV